MQSRRTIAVWLGLATFTFLIYVPGLTSEFLFDDYPNIVENPKLHISSLTLDQLEQAALSSNAGPLRRPVAMLSFALNYYFTKLDPFYFKLTNLLLHLVTGLFVFLLARLLLTLYADHFNKVTTRSGIALGGLLTSALWLLHPFNLTTVLLPVQRMMLLASLFTVLAMYLYLWGRQRQIDGRPGAPQVGAALLLCWPLAILSKETALLLPAFLFLAEWLVLGFPGKGLARPRWITALTVGFFLIPVLATLSYLALKGVQLVQGYELRPFTLEERLLTEPRVVWMYAGLSLVPRLSALGLYHDDIALSTDLFTPPTTVLAILGLIAAVAFAMAARRRMPLVSFGILFFLIGHSLESSFLSLEIAHEHRNYLPVFGLLLPVAHYLSTPLIARPAPWVRQSTALILVLGLAFLTSLRAQTWGDPVTLAATWITHHPESARSHQEAARIYFNVTLDAEDPQTAARFYEKAVVHFETSAALNVYHSGSLVSLIKLNSVLKYPQDKETVNLLMTRLATGLVSPATVQSLRDLNQCLLRGDCAIQADLIVDLLQTAKSNPRIDTRSRAILASELMLVYLRAGRPDLALPMATEATELDPGIPQHRLNLIALLIAKRDFQGARQNIDILESRRLDAQELSRLRTQRERLLAMEQANEPGG